jgi:hypothetical protein
MSQDDIENEGLICLVGVASPKPVKFVMFHIAAVGCASEPLSLNNHKVPHPDVGFPLGGGSTCLHA